MLNKLYTSIVMAVVIALTPILLAVAPVFAEGQSAQALPATSFEQAGGPISGSIQIPAHSSQWFKFKYYYDNSETDNNPTEAQVMVKTATPEAIRFEVWTRDRMQSPQYDAQDTDHEDGQVLPVGHGTPLTIGTTHERESDGSLHEETIVEPQTLVWAGGQDATDTFYVLVKNTSDAPVNYTISISGPDVSY